jgi:hypothetical protein
VTEIERKLADIFCAFLTERIHAYDWGDIDGFDEDEELTPDETEYLLALLKRTEVIIK